MKALEYALEQSKPNSKFENTNGLKKALGMFEAGYTLGEIVYDETVWADKSLNVWTLDSLSNLYSEFVSLNDTSVISA